MNKKTAAISLQTKPFGLGTFQCKQFIFASLFYAKLAIEKELAIAHGSQEFV